MSPMKVEACESYRNELTAYCYRFFASWAEAEDAVQETMIRAWRKGEGFEGRSSLRRWLYAVATNVCLDMGRSQQRRSLPVDMSAPGPVPAGGAGLSTSPEVPWVGPVADRLLVDDPAVIAGRRDSVRLAFIAALQYLPPRQRAVLILRDVLAWRAAECSTILGTSVAAVNSALARARATMKDRAGDAGDAGTGPVEFDRGLLERYVSAFEAYDVDGLVGLLAEDAAFSMPPYRLWFRGRRDIRTWWQGPGVVCRNSRTLTTAFNGQPAVAAYHPTGGPRLPAFALHVLDMRDGRITGITHFMGPEVFAQFGLPPDLPADFSDADR